MDLRQLGAFVAVVDEGGFTKAATALLVAQPSLSQSIRTLEAELGAPLFHRLPRSVVLTPAGEALLPHARQALRDAAAGRAAVAAVAGLDAGRLDLVSLPTLAVAPAAGLVGGFLARHPQVVVHMAEPEGSGGVEAALLSGSAEVGLVDLEDLDERTSSALVAHPLVGQEYAVVLPPGSRRGGRRLAIADLAEHRLVVTPPGTSTRRILDAALAAAGMVADVAVVAAQREALVPLVLAGAGAALLPLPLAKVAEVQGAVVVRLHPPLTRRIGLVHRDATLTPAARAFVEEAVG